MRIPKYLRPIYNVEEHGLTKTEITVRMIVFVPFLIIFALPSSIAFAFLLLLSWIFVALFMNGIGNILAHPMAYKTEGLILVGIVTLIICSKFVANKIRQYFLPFGY